MGFFIGMFICNLLIPLIMIIAGYCMYKKPPKEINGLIGYRTSMSKKSKETWAFAHDFCGRLWIKGGWILLVISVIAQIPFAHASENQIGIATTIIEVVQIAILLYIIAIVEKALKQNFDENGMRK